MEKYALITGSYGLVGSESSIFFDKKKFKIIGIDNDMRKYFFGKSINSKNIKKKLNNECKSYKHYNYDIRSYKNLEKIFKKFKKKIKIIIHAAAQPSHDWAKKEPDTDFSINANGTLNLLMLFKKHCPDAKFIFLSTNKVYGDNPNKFKFDETKNRYEMKKSNRYYNGFDESLKLDNCIHSLFGVSKLSADMMVQEYGKNFGLKTVCFRAGCISGPNHLGAELHGFLSFLVKSAIINKSYKIFGYKGKQVRDNIHSKDLVNCFWEYYKKPKCGEVYNIGGGRKSNISILEGIKYIEKKLKFSIKKKYFKINRTGDHKWYISSNNKFRKDYKKWNIRYTAYDLIDEIIQNKNFF